MEQLLQTMSDDELVSSIEKAFEADPLRMDKILTKARLQYIQRTQSSMLTTITTSATTAASMPPPSSSVLMFPPKADAFPSDSSSEPAAADTKDPINALWTFEGHQLRQLQPGTTQSRTNATEVDEDGHAILYGSCGRDKRYARCSVCYFRGLRCNTSYYCGCCQRPICIRPRKYPEEEHAKICWNVLHLDQEMVHRVEKKKKRKVQIISMQPPAEEEHQEHQADEKSAIGLS